MKKAISFITISICILIYSPLYTQEKAKTISIDGEQIDLEEIDLNKGSVISKIEGYEKCENCLSDSILFEKTQEIYCSPSRSHYLVINKKRLIQNYGSSYRSVIDYYNINGDTLFNMITKLDANALITFNGKYIFLNIRSEDSSSLLIIEETGGIIKQINDKYLNLNTQNLHKSILISCCDFYKSKSKFIFFNEWEGIVDESTHDQYLKVSTVSGNEKYFGIVNDDSIFVFTNNGKLYWSIKKDTPSRVYLFNNGQKYLLQYKDTLSNKFFLAIKEVQSNNTLKIIESISYERDQFEVYRVGFTDDSCSSFYISNYYQGMEYFNFFTPEGEKINEARVHSHYKEYGFEFRNGIYVIIPKSNYDE